MLKRSLRTIAVYKACWVNIARLMRSRKEEDTVYIFLHKDDFEATGVKAMFFGAASVMRPIVTGEVNLDVLESTDKKAMQAAQKALLDVVNGIIINIKKFEQLPQIEFAKIMSIRG